LARVISGGLYVIQEFMNTTRVIQISDGDLLICGVTPSEKLEEMSIDLMLKAFRPARRQKQSLIEISKLKRGKVVTAQLNDEIVGYVTFHPPDNFERWSSGPEEIIELGAIEVSPKVRKYGVARQMLEVAFEDKIMENYLVIATEYYWHWDMEGTGMHIWEYREMMRHLMENVDMVVRDTDEQEISSHPANMLMVRFGNKLSSATIKQFESLLFTE